MQFEDNEQQNKPIRQIRRSIENTFQQASCSTAELNSYSSLATDTSSAEYGDPYIQNA